MAEYFFLIHGPLLEEELRPILGECWQQRSFLPCRALCERLLPQAKQFAEKYYLGEQPLLIESVLRDPTFDRDIWKSLISELLFVTATDIPEVQSAYETLCRLVTPPLDPRQHPPRAQYQPLRRVHFGARDLTFAGTVYRPNHAGYNPADEVRTLADYLEGINPDAWEPARLTHLRDEEDRLDEIEFTRQIFELIRDMYHSARERRQAIVCEEVEV